jgi:iron complex transport system ATP-binding protein
MIRRGLSELGFGGAFSDFSRGHTSMTKGISEETTSRTTPSSETAANASGEKSAGPQALLASHVCAAYGASGVLSDVSLSLSRGEVLVVIGPNGAGKSTLVRVLSGVLAPTSGSVRLFGDDVASLSRRQVARRLAVVSQTSEVPRGFRAEDVVMMGRTPHQRALHVPTREDWEIVRWALERAHVVDLRSRRVEELSGGEQKLVALARALAQRPDVLLLDEASAFLDPQHAIAFHELVVSEAKDRGVACVAVGHDLNLAATYADRVLLLKQGRVGLVGTVDEVMTAPHLRSAFGVELHVGVDPTAGARYFIPRRTPRPPSLPPVSGASRP